MLAANSAYDFEEFAACLKKAFTDCKHVEYLEKFTNFSETVEPLLNTASTTPGFWNSDLVHAYARTYF